MRGVQLYGEPHRMTNGILAVVVDGSGFAGSLGAWVVKVRTPIGAGAQEGLALRRYPIL